MQNHLKHETSPYLLQHVENPVNWYPWGEEAFAKAREEDKPVFLSIGYSTCHWCHVMAHESFEDEQIAELLNKYYVSIKVDKEERPDIDSIYMSVCQAFTGSGGWPMTIIMTPDQKPFFAGTYFPKTSKYGRVGLGDLLLTIHGKWMTERENLLRSSEEIINFLQGERRHEGPQNQNLIEGALNQFRRNFDSKHGGFGDAPKFPTPHNLLFLLQQYEKTGEKQLLSMVEKTLLQMYRGGIFDHIGGGFCRYSTDKYFLVPHFEKMLYDNALLILTYCKAYAVTGKRLYRDVAEKTGKYVLREMTDGEGGFASAQDADSEGVEGKFYLFTPAEIDELFDKKTAYRFKRHFDITERGNFEGKNIPNLLKTPASEVGISFDDSLPEIYAYRKARYALHLDDKVLTSWNALMIAAMCRLYEATERATYLDAAVSCLNFIEDKMLDGDDLAISYRKGKRKGKGLLDDYAFLIFALLNLYDVTKDEEHLDRAKRFTRKAVKDFFDEEEGGFFLYGEDHEQLILRPKETYDGAVFSGNSAMAYNLVQLWILPEEDRYRELAEKQLDFMACEAEHYPAGYSLFLMALSDYLDPPAKVTVVERNGKKEYYICEGQSCRPLPTKEAPSKGYY